MKFSNTTYGFYPSDETKLAEYVTLPDDLQNVSDEDYLKFQTGEIGPLVFLKDTKLITHIIQKTEEEKLSDFLSLVSNALSFCNSVGLQCYMTGSTFPDDWASYRSELVVLSAITEWDDILSLPTQPDLPSGVII